MPGRGLELKVPPVALVLVTGALMWIGTWSVPRLTHLLPGRYYVAGAVGLTGALICLLGVASFRRAKTTVNPMKPESSSSLVTSGIYRMTRNPMYLGFALILLGWSAFCSNALALALVPLFVFYLDRFQIRPEERALEALFGQDFIAYKGRVRRWI